MDIRNRIQEIAVSGRFSLTEHEAKQLLQTYGVPVVAEAVVQTADAAADAASAMGFPAVVKGLGARLLHKTEKGLVRLHLKTPEDVREAVASITASAGSDLEGVLVQPQLAGRREFVAGIFRDPHFGPVVMFGLGGVFTEALSDVSVRLAPLGAADAEDMIGEIRASAMLGPFRGEAPVDRACLVRILLGLSRMAMELPDVLEVDVNPLLAGPDGSVRAVDALAVIGGGPPDTPPPPPVEPRAIGALFYPRSIAFVGASSQMGKWGHMLLTNTVSGGYEGDVYLVNPRGGTIAGRHVFRSVTEIPDPVDLAVVTIPADRVPGLIPEFGRKGIRNLLLITSGFSETGPQGRRLEEDLVAAARKEGILILGPNTMGICNPHIHLYCTGSLVRPRAGTTAMVAQSGNMGTQLLAFAEDQGIGIRAFSGSGNEAMIAIEDYLEGFEVDELSRIVMLYIESVKNGRRFFESACRVGRKKPIILLKGGQSRVGNRAAASHTGAMTTDVRVFDAMCRQSGIVKVEHSMDLLDLSAAFSSLPLPRGNRVGIVTLGGGWGVVTADLCAAHGLEVPDLTPDLVSRMDAILPAYWSRSNPVDIVGERDFSIPLTVLEALLRWDDCDGVINLGILGRRIFVNRMARAIQKADPGFSREFLEEARQALGEFEVHYVREIVRLMKQYGKPVIGVSLLKEPGDQTVYRIDDTDVNGVFFETPERAVKALARMVEYERWLSRATEAPGGPPGPRPAGMEADSR